MDFSKMNRTRLLTLLSVGLFLLFMVAGFGSSANSPKPGNGTPRPKVSGYHYDLIERKTGRNDVTRLQLGDDLNEQIESKSESESRVDEQVDDEDSDPDMPAKFHGEIDEATYLQMRDEYIGMRRGIEPGRPFDPRVRGEAIRQMEGQERGFIRKTNGSFLDALESALGISPAAGGAWTPLGPAPLTNGRVQGFLNAPVSGRATAIAVDPTDSSKVYLGTAQGGVWRSLDGGATWTNIFDSAQSLAIGAIAIPPSNPSIVYVGTGEANQSGDSFFGVGLYRIENASSSADLVGPINPFVTTGIAGTSAFTGRSISKILVDPN